MHEFKSGDKVVHVGGTMGVNSPNRGILLTVLDGPLSIRGFTGDRYIVDRPISFAHGTKVGYHANGVHLTKVK